MVSVYIYVCVYVYTHIYMFYLNFQHMFFWKVKKKSITLRKKPIWKLESCQGNKHVTIFWEGNEWCTD